MTSNYNNNNYELNSFCFTVYNHVKSTKFNKINFKNNHARFGLIATYVQFIHKINNGMSIIITCIGSKTAHQNNRR